MQYEKDFACNSQGGYFMHDSDEAPQTGDPIDCVENCLRVKVHMYPALMFGRPWPRKGPFNMELVEPVNSVLSERRSDRPRGCYFDRSHPARLYFNSHPFGRGSSNFVSISKRRGCGQDESTAVKNNATTTNTTGCGYAAAAKKKLKPGGVKYLIGVMSADRFREVEEMFEKWLPNLVDTTGSHWQLKPGLNFVFVLGKPARPYKHRWILEINENMDRGKSIEYFMAAGEKFSDADYVLKMDLDTGVCPNKLRKLLGKAAVDRADYIGWLKCCSIGIWRGSIFQHKKLVMSPKDMICPRGEPGTWMYMQGSFYGLSRKAILKLIASSFAQHVRKVVSDQREPEDLATGALLYYVMPRPRVFSLDHVNGCTNKMNYVSGPGDTATSLAATTCPVMHLNSRSFKDNKLAASRSTCAVFRNSTSLDQMNPWGRCAAFQYSLCKGKDLNSLGYPHKCCRIPFDDWIV